MRIAQLLLCSDLMLVSFSVINMSINVYVLIINGLLFQVRTLVQVNESLNIFRGIHVIIYFDEIFTYSVSFIKLILI